MPNYPVFPLPSAVSAPAMLDPVLRFQSDQGYEVRRAQTMRPRRQYVLSYLGKSTHELRLIREFFYDQRGGTLPFSWWHPTAEEPVTFANTTPVLVAYTMAHGLLSGQMIEIFSSPGELLSGYWRITTQAVNTLLLNGSVARGSGAGTARVYLPKAVGRFSDDTLPAAARLSYGGGEGHLGQNQRWNWDVQIEELY